jgi:perosamine synthetase
VIPYNKPHMNTDKILQEMRKILESGWIGIGPKTKEFEDRLGDYWGVSGNRVCCTNNGTAALHMAVKRLGLAPGTCVATTPITFVATNHVLLYENLRPIFYDVEPTTGCADVASLKNLLGSGRFGAIMVVHMAGYPCDMQKINAIAAENHVTVIEDCAHAMGAVYETGKRVGDSDNVCCFSFHAVKNLPTGDGGAIAMPQEDGWYRKARWMGIDQDSVSKAAGVKRKWEYAVDFLGWKYHLNDIAAVIGLAQLEILDESNARRKEIADYYRDNLRTATFPDYDDKRTSSYHYYPVFFDNRDAVYDALTREDIWPGMHYARNDKLGVYRGAPKGDLKGAQWYEEHELTLPMYYDLEESDFQRITEVANNA